MDDAEERREAEVLQLCLLRLEAGEAVEEILADAPYHATQLRPLLVVVDDLEHWIPATLQVEARQAMRAQTQAALARRGMHQTGPLHGQHWPRPHLRMAQFAFALLVVCCLCAAPAVVAAQSSLPGDRLYPLKRQTERIQLSLAVSQADKATL